MRGTKKEILGKNEKRGMNVLAKLTTRDLETDRGSNVVRTMLRKTKPMLGSNVSKNERHCVLSLVL